jgi:hypothetical protein
MARSIKQNISEEDMLSPLAQQSDQPHRSLASKSQDSDNLR